jgi:hypothetical protein
VLTPAQLALLELLAFFLLGGCRVSAPEKGTDTVTLMARYNQQGRHDDAIKVAQDWLNKHPEDASHRGILYGQIAITYLMKASKDSTHKDEWIRQAVAYYDQDIALH